MFACRSVRIWQRRDSGQYWPSVCHFLPSIPSCFHYTPDNRRMFIGLDNGTVTVSARHVYLFLLWLSNVFSCIVIREMVVGARREVVDMCYVLNLIEFSARLWK